MYRLDGVPSIEDWMGYPPSKTGWGTPVKDWMGYPPPKLVEVPPSKTGWGTLPPSGDRSAERALTMQQAVCLLHSRRTFFCQIILYVALTF